METKFEYKWFNQTVQTYVNERKLKIKIKLEMTEYFGSLIICSLRKMKNLFSFSILHSHHQIIETARQNEFCSLLSTSSIPMTRHLQSYSSL